MLTGHGERSRVIEAIKIGVNEFLLKPVSSKSLQDRMMSVLAKPRPMVQIRRLLRPDAAQDGRTSMPTATRRSPICIIVN